MFLSYCITILLSLIWFPDILWSFPGPARSPVCSMFGYYNWNYTYHQVRFSCITNHNYIIVFYNHVYVRKIHVIFPPQDLNSPVKDKKKICFTVWTELSVQDWEVNLRYMMCPLYFTWTHRNTIFCFLIYPNLMSLQ